jgi:hypothetical protein
MPNSITWVGMDVHAENFVLAAFPDNSDAALFRMIIVVFPCSVPPQKEVREKNRNTEIHA